MTAFHGKPPDGGAGEMSLRTERLRPAIALRPAQLAEPRRLRPLGAEPEQIATVLGAAPSTSCWPRTRSSWRSGLATNRFGRRSTAS